MSAAAPNTASRFSDRDIAQFRDEGFVVARGLVTGARLAELIRWADELEEPCLAERSLLLPQRGG